MVAKFYKIEVVVEANNPVEAYNILSGFISDTAYDIWLKGDAESLTEEEIKDFFDYDQEAYDRNVLGVENNEM